MNLPQINKHCFVIIHGKSVEELEQRIGNYRDLDVCWASMSTFDIPQTHILDKINKKFDIVFDSSTVKNYHQYELEVRIPRLTHYFHTSKGYYICTKSDKNNLYNLRNAIVPGFNSKYSDRIIYSEDLGIDPNPFCVSLHLFIACLVKLGVKKIILFGADGGGTYGNSVESYYKSDLVLKDKQVADNVSYNMVGDTNNINSSWEPLMKQTLGYVPEILNCSPITTYTCWRKITYNEVIKELT